MFSITADGVLFYDGIRIGTIELKRDTTGRDGARYLDFVARGITLEIDPGPEGGYMGDVVMFSSIGASGAVREYVAPEGAE